jgi:hypothetical protein
MIAIGAQALCQGHGISSVLTNDRGVERFKGISVQYR